MSPNAESYTDSKIVGKVAKKWIRKKWINRKVKDVFSFFKTFLVEPKVFSQYLFSMGLSVIFSAVLSRHKNFVLLLFVSTLVRLRNIEGS